jgi:UDP-N-acetylmuramate dehydrogenase
MTYHMERNIQKNILLAPHSSWLVGGPAEFYCEPYSIDELKEAIVWAGQKNLPITVLGGGTNVLISDAGVRGLVVSLGKLTGIEMIGENQGVGEPMLRFWAMAGTTKSELLKIFLKNKLEPACFLAGLPGQVGGGVVMNAGVSEKLTPREFVEITEAIEVLRPDGSLEMIKAAALQWGYRHCSGWKPGIITRVLIAVPNAPNVQCLEKVRTLNKTRLSKQPLEWPSCGSVFRNPLPQHAGRLIEEAGLKGHAIGGAQVSEKHANFIVNKGDATARDIKSLIDLCKQRVREKSGIELQTEVVWIGAPL